MRGRDLQLLGGIVVLAAIARFATLDLQSFWYDEAVTVGLVEMDFGDMLDRIPESESTPPLYYWLAWVWAKLFGTGEVGLRSLSALFGTAAIPVVYAAGARLATRRAGLFGAAIVAVSPVLIWFSQDARAYSLAVLLSALSFYFFVAARETADRRDLACWAAFSALALATHYFTAFLVIAEAALLLWRRREARALIAVGAVALAGAALLPLAIHQSNTGHADWVGKEDLGDRVSRTAVKLIGDDGGDEHGARQPGPLPVAIPVLLALAGFALLALRADPPEWRGALLALSVAGIGLLLPFLIGRIGSDYLLGRNLLPLFLPLLLALAIGYAARRAGLLGLACCAALCLTSLAYVVQMNRLPRLQREDLRHAAEVIGPAQGPRAVVTVNFFADVPLAYYLGATRAGGSPLRVSEIDVVGYGTPGRTARAGIPSAFRRVDVEPVTYNFTLTRFRAPRPTPVPFRSLNRGALVGSGGRAAVLVQSGGQRPGT